MFARTITTVLSALVLGAFATATAPASAATALTNNVNKAISSQNDAANHQQFFYISVPNNASKLVVKTWNSSFLNIGNADLYVKFNDYPTLASYHARSIGPTNSDSVTINNPAPGMWRVMVNSKVNYTAVLLRASITMNPAPPPQVWNFNNLSATTGNYQLFWVDVPPGKTTLKLETSGGFGDPALVYRFGAAPTWNLYDYLQQSPWNTNEWISVSHPSVGRHYLWVLAASSYSGVNLKITLQ